MRPCGLSRRAVRHEREIVPDLETVEAAVYGGCILGGGGGGWVHDGLTRGKLAVTLGEVRIVPVDALPADAVVVTASAVGAPGSKDRYLLPVHHVRAMYRLIDAIGAEPAAVVSNENGASGTVNGWLQAALLGIPVVDAPGDGRAHPTAAMGSCGLWSLEGYESVQSAVGGNPRKGMQVEMVVRGAFKRCGDMVRQAAVQAGGAVAVARDPLPLEYLKRNAACGAIAQAISLGRTFLDGKRAGPEGGVEAACRFLRGEVVYRGLITSLKLETRGGFDVGSVELDSGRCELTFWNEYMTLEMKGERLATFPDLIMTFDDEGEPVVSAALREGQSVTVIRAPKEALILGSGMKDPECYRDAELTVGKEIIRFAFNY